MKILRSSDVGGIPVEAIHRLSQLLTQPTTPIADGIEIYPRVSPWQPLRSELLVDAATFGDFPDRWAQIEQFDRQAHYELSADRVSARQKALSRLRKGQFGDFVWPIALSSPDERFVSLNEVLLPAFFEEHTCGQVRLVRYDNSFNSPLSLLSILQRARILQTGDPDELQRLAGTSALSSLSLHVPAEALFYTLSLGLTWTYPTVYGFVGTCKHEHFLVFVLGRPFEVNIEDATSFERMTPGLGNVMNSRVHASLIVPQTYVPAERSYPLSRRTFSRDEVLRYLETYIDAVGSTFAWLSDFDNFAKANHPDTFDIDFAQAVWLTVFVLVVTQFSILQSQQHFARKLSYFDSLELLAALVTSRQNGQTSAWLTLSSDAFARTTLAPAVARYGGGVGADLVAAVEAIRTGAEAIVKDGLIYPRNQDGSISIPNNGSLTFERFEPALYRALRNTRHGFAINGSDLLSIHSGEIHNDLPDLSIALFLGLLIDKAPYPLSRS